jgi:hypothetical protein
VTFILGSSQLGGSGFAYTETTFEDRGRSIVVEWSQSGANQDMELYGFAIRFAAGDEEAKDTGAQ